MRAWPTDRVVLGGDYNPEQWPGATLDEDLVLMAEAGVGFVTVGVFAWALLEPRPGEFEFGWLDRVMDRLGDAGIAVDLATATASPPPWFARVHPEALPVTRDGVRLTHGSRQTWCPSAPAFRERSLALVTRLAERYRDHPALAMWHVNNELGCHNVDSYSDASAAHFRRWLMDRHGDLDALNDAWGTTFWSQRYTDLADVLPPRATTAVPNPGHVLDWRRFCSDAVLAQHLAEREVLHRLSPGVPVTTNVMVMDHVTGMDYWRWAPHQDVVSNDHYLWQGYEQPHLELSRSADVTRGLAGGAPWVLMEHSASAVNWQPVNPAKEPGELLRNSLAHVARGADAVGFFQWRQSRAGAEKYHSALVPHAGRDSRLWREAVELGRVLAAITEVAGSRVEAPVALVHDWPSWWATDAPSTPTQLHRYADEVATWYDALWRAGVTCDVVNLETGAHGAPADLTAYAAVVLPATHVVSEAAAGRVAAAVAAGVRVLVTYFSGIVDERDHVHLGGYPGAFRDLLGVRVEEFAPLLPGGSAALAGELGDGLAGRIWTERGRATAGTQVLAWFADGPAAGSPAVTRRAVGEAGGQAWYVATRLDAAGADRVTAALLAGTAAAPVLAGLPPGVEAVRRRAADGTSYLFVLDHPGEGVTLDVRGVDLVTGAACGADSPLTVAPGAVAVVREG
ncbi:MAG: beta-galactosidase [Kineosporiaceae bacterium]